jgi:hypothetical protein
MRIKGITEGGAFRRAALLGVLALALLLPGSVTAQKPAHIFTWAAPTGASVQWLDLSRFGGFLSKHTIQIDVSGGPSGCTVKLEGSNLGPEANSGAGPTDSQYFSLSGDVTCTSNTMVHVVNKSVRTVRANRTVWTGGTTPSLSVVYTYGQ